MFIFKRVPSLFGKKNTEGLFLNMDQKNAPVSENLGEIAKNLFFFSLVQVLQI